MRSLPTRLTGTFLMVALLVVGGLAFLAHARGTSTNGAMGASGAPSPTTCAGQPEGASIEVSYVSWPSNLHDLKAMSDLIVEVRIVAFARYEGGSPGGSSVYSARVMTANGGKHALGITAGSTIQVRQAGGRDGCVTYQVDGDPLMQPGERDILFLTTYKGDPVYDIVNDTVGRFQVDDSGHLLPNTTAPVTLAAGTSDTAFIRAIQQA